MSRLRAMLGSIAMLVLLGSVSPASADSPYYDDDWYGYYGSYDGIYDDAFDDDDWYYDYYYYRPYDGYYDYYDGYYDWDVDLFDWEEDGLFQ
jgi:hypothetical protein